MAREAVDASNEGLKVVEQSNAQADEGAKGLEKILDGVTEATRVVGQITRASDEQREAARNVVARRSRATAEQARLVAGATDEQAKSVDVPRPGEYPDPQDRRTK